MNVNMAPLLADAKIFVVLTIVSCFFVPSSPNSTTPIPTTAGQQSSATPTTRGQSSVAASSSQPPTTRASTTEQIATTAATLPASTETPANTDIGPCVCDLTGNACDVNCCCDPDCTAADTQTFSECLQDDYIVEDKVCVRQSVVYSTNDPPGTIDESDPSLFCIVQDNYATRNYYTVPQTVDTVEQFYELSDKYGSTSYAQPSETNTTYADFYKAGDVIYTLYETLALGQLGLPHGLGSDVCDDNNPAAYLYDQTSTCTRVLTSLESDCEKQPYLSARTYYEGFKVIPTPQFLQDNPLPAPILVNLTSPLPTTTQPTTPPVATTPDTNTTQDPNATQPSTQPTILPTTEFPGYTFYDNAELVNVTVKLPVLCRIVFGFVVDCNLTAEEIPMPYYNASTETCQDVVLEVTYIITHNSTDGIEEVDVELMLGSVTTTNPTQTFSTSFVKRDEDEEEVFHKSGNPGYVVGLPLLAGNLVEETQPDGSIKQAISIGSDPNNWMTVVKSSADGSCMTDADMRIPVTFGENLRSGCTIQVSYENVSDVCGLIQSTALNALRGDQPTHVATFGNSSAEMVGDWVEIFQDPTDDPAVSTEQGSCTGLYMSLNIEVLYANVGALSNPQPKIIGVNYNYPVGSGNTLKYQCIGPYCQEGSESLVQKFEVAVSVQFIDASQYPKAVYAEKPTFQSQLPSDFFYPFSGSSKAIKLSFSFILHCVVLIVSLAITL